MVKAARQFVGRGFFWGAERLSPAGFAPLQRSGQRPWLGWSALKVGMFYGRLLCFGTYYSFLRVRVFCFLRFEDG